MFQLLPTGIVAREAELRPILSVLNNIESQYRYLLLAAHITQETYEILFVTMR